MISRSISTSFLISAALLACASCSSTTPPPPPQASVSTVHPKEWSGQETPSHPLPPIRPSDAIAPPATEPSEEFTLIGHATTRPARVEANITPPAPPVEPEVIAPPPPAVPRRREMVKQQENLPEQPGPDNTGVKDQKNLKISQKVTVTDGQVIENLFITGGVIANDSKNVIIRNCLIDAAGARYGVMCQRATNLLIEHCEIYNAGSACVFGDGFTARWNNCYASAGDGFKPENDCVVESNWVHQLGFKSPGAHADGVQIRGANNIKVINNYFDMSLDDPDTHSNSSVFIQGIKNKKGTNNVLIQGNWCRGGNFTIHGYSDGGDATTIQIINNRFMQGSSRYGIGRIQEGVVWKGNVFDESNAEASPSQK